MASKKKLATTAVALTTAAALLLGGTFAWQSINQTALNEASDVVNPGGRLHDDFDGTNKDIYVENFADEPIYARVRLSEYFEVIMNYGVEGAAVSDQILGSKNDDGTYNYELYKFDGHVDETGKVNAAIDPDDGTSYWNWTTGGSTVYMPTFNMNKDSLVADINGIYEEGNIGTISNRDGTQYTEYTDWSAFEGENGVTGVGATKSGTEIYDGDVNSIDEVGTDLANAANYTDNVTTVDVSGNDAHIAANTLNAELISMAEWDGTAGPYWVYDTDGWVYWAQAIEPDTATGLLLDNISLNGVMDDTWYYAIYVEGQFITADDIGDGSEENPGFVMDGMTDEAKELLKTIGVDVSGETATPDDGGDSGGDDDDEISVLSVYRQLEDGSEEAMDAESDGSYAANVGETIIIRTSSTGENASWGYSYFYYEYDPIETDESLTLTIDRGSFGEFITYEADGISDSIFLHSSGNPGYTLTNNTTGSSAIYDNYAVVTLEAGSYTLTLNPESGQIFNSAVNAMSYSTSPTGLNVAANEAVENDDGGYTLSCSFTLDSRVPAGTYQIVSENPSSGQDVSRMLVVNWAGSDETIGEDDGYSIGQSSEEIMYDDDGMPYVEINRNRTGDVTWNLWGASDGGEFTLSSDNENVWFIPYGEYEDGSTEPSNQGDDMYVIIPSSVTDDFTVTVNQVNGSGTVTIKVIMADIPSVAYFTASYDDYAADEDGNINIAHNVYVNEDYADKTDASKDYNLNVTAYDTDGEKIEGYSSYYVRLNSLNVTDGYHTSVDDEENCSGTVTRDGYAHWAVSIYDDTLTIDALYDTLDEYDGELLFSDDLTVTYEIEVCDEESNVTSKINVTVQITVPDVSNS